MWICSRAVSRSKNDDAWSCTPIRGSSAALRGQTASPSTRTLPASGRRSPSIISSSGGLAGAVGSEDADELTLGDLELTPSTALRSP